ncbi:hypothetical protein N0V91_005106 [Didymella pomorum]|uniref:Uncharacterized protein n=1 Tax=Didymella pomorum TaxID=749634 RepID=A0A9W9D7H5_9PLEO|nr:hypothetical protein N0V91_005106 [Didymella pomorum]
MWTSEHHKNLTGAIDECDGALKAVFRAVQIADEESRIVAISKKANNYIEHLLAEGSHALESVVRCSSLVSKTKVIVRHTLLSQTEILNDDEIEELLRLIQALQHPDLQLIWVRKDESFASKQMQRFSIPPPTISIGPSAAETASTSSPLDRSPGSTVKPVLTPDCPLTAPQQTTEPGEVAFGEPSVINPTPSRSVFANVTSTSGFANYSKPKSNVFGPRPPHLEGYIIRPTVQTMGSTTS